MSDKVMRAVYPMSANALVAGLALTVWLLERELWFVWTGVAVMLPIAWGVLEGLRNAPSDEVRRSIFFASFMLAFPLLFTIGISIDLYDGQARTLASNALGLLMGGVLIFMGNYIPKRLPPLDDAEFDPVRVQAVHRFTGWAFVLAGLGYIAAWLILPTVPANIVATALALIASGLVLARRALARRPR